jgi:beta-1,4-mannosyl-glycoprotein beta-1,4-N-acetylglucosaminyltransferase
MKIIDCFTFYNELDLLKYRFNLLNSSVDYFILAEATHTHAGFQKPLFFEENRALFKEFEHKIIHLIVDDFPFKKENEVEPFKERYQWTNERWQRDAIKKKVDSLGLADEDLVMVCDLDEIPNPAVLLKGITTLCILEMDMYYYTLQYKMRETWHLARVAPYSFVKNISSYSKDMRLASVKKIIKAGGWHLSYFMSPLLISNKLRNFAHQEFNRSEFTEPELIRVRIEKGDDLFNRGQVVLQQIPISKNTKLPPNFQKYLSAFL